MRFLLVVGFLLTSIQAQAQTFGWGVPADGTLSSRYGSNVDVNGNYSIGFGLDPTVPTTITAPNTMAIMGGKVGVGTTAPTTELDVSGSVRLGNNGETCAAAIEGAIRYNSTNKTIELCDGTGWSEINLSCDITPDGFDITDVGSVATGTLQTSPIVQITGITCSVTVSISGTGSPQYRTCSNSDCSTEVQTWTDANGSISNNQYLQLRLTASPDSFSTRTATVTVGGAVDNWTVTTVNDGTYKRVFVTGIKYSGSQIAGIAGADAKCQSLADAESLGGTFKAWIATDSTDDPESRFTQANVPYKRVDGLTVANDWADLVDGGNLINKILTTANGSVWSSWVWTNIAADGTANSETNNCSSWTSNSTAISSTIGQSSAANSTWTDYGTYHCGNPYGLYCFEQ